MTQAQLIKETSLYGNRKGEKALLCAACAADIAERDGLSRREKPDSRDILPARCVHLWGNIEELILEETEGGWTASGIDADCPRCGAELRHGRGDDGGMVAECMSCWAAWR